MGRSGPRLYPPGKVLQPRGCDETTFRAWYSKSQGMAFMPRPPALWPSSARATPESQSKGTVFARIAGMPEGTTLLLVCDPALLKRRERERVFTAASAGAFGQRRSPPCRILAFGG